MFQSMLTFWRREEPKFVKVRKIWWAPEWAYAFTMYPFIFMEPQVWDDKCVRQHELYHWYDQEANWVIPWVIKYAILGIWGIIIRQPNSKHPMEREAYRIQRQCEK